MASRKSGLQVKKEEMSQLQKRMEELKLSMKQLEEDAFNRIGKLYVQSLDMKPSEIDLDEIESFLKEEIKQKKAAKKNNNNQ